MPISKIEKRIPSHATARRDFFCAACRVSSAGRIFDTLSPGQLRLSRLPHYAPP